MKPDSRSLIMPHQQELVEQTYQEFRKQSLLLIGSGVEKVRILAVSEQHMKMSEAADNRVHGKRGTSKLSE